MKMEEKRRTIDRLLSDTPTSEAPSMTIKSVSSITTRTVKVEEELLDAVEERVRKVLQVRDSFTKETFSKTCLGLEHRPT
jgi:hypothetical protein